MNIEILQREYDSGKSINDLRREHPEITHYFLRSNLTLRTRAEGLRLSHSLNPRSVSEETKKTLSERQRLAHAQNRHPGWAHKNQDPTRSSYPERWMRSAMSNHSVLREHQVVEQLSVGKYFLDFAFVNLLIDLEVDGSQHDRPEAIMKDQVRDAFLSSQGWKVYRIKWKECYADPQKTLKMLAEFISNLKENT